MRNCQAPRKPYRVSQMTTIFITLLCFPSFLGASVCVTYTMWRYVNVHTPPLISHFIRFWRLSQRKLHGLFPLCSITPSTSCGPFRGLKTMFQAGKHWVMRLEEENPNLSVLARAHSYLVEHPFFLFLGAGIFL